MRVHLGCYLFYCMQEKKSTYTLEEAKRSLERYCVYQDRCHQEIERKLKEMRMIPEARELILLHLMKHDFLNEERFARSFARGKFRIKQWGRSRIERELKQRDISAYNVKAGLSEISPEAYEKTFLEVSRKRFNGVREPDHGSSQHHEPDEPRQHHYRRIGDGLREVSRRFRDGGGSP